MEQNTEIIKFLKQVPMFANLRNNSLWRLADLAQAVTYPKGSIILEEGAHAQGCFIIKSGQVEVIKSMGTASEKRIAILSSGDIVGEMAVIDDEPHSASVRTLEDTECVKISHWDFKAQLQAYPEIALQLLPIIVRRLRRVLQQVDVKEESK